VLIPTALIAAGLIPAGLAAGRASVPGRDRPGGTLATRQASAVFARGVDVSSFQHPGGAAINWRSVARAGYRFAFIKATEGTYYVSTNFRADAAAAKAAGLLVAAYHFANPERSSGTAQADFALNHGAYRADGRTLRMILDIEVDPYLTKVCYGLSPAKMVSWIAAFMGEVYRRTGMRPVINTQPAWWDKCTGSTHAFVADQLWVQDHKAGARSPALPAGWAGWSYWQYSITGRVPGITGSTDLNRLSPALLAVANPGAQSYQAGRRVRVQVRSANAAAGQALGFTATGLPSGLSINRASGVISGTLPSTPRSTAVTVTVSAAGAAPVTLRFTWHVHGKVKLTARDELRESAVVAAEAAGMARRVDEHPDIACGWCACPPEFRPTCGRGHPASARRPMVRVPTKAVLSAGEPSDSSRRRTRARNSSLRASPSA